MGIKKEIDLKQLFDTASSAALIQGIKTQELNDFSDPLYLMAPDVIIGSKPLSFMPFALPVGLFDLALPILPGPSLSERFGNDIVIFLGSPKGPQPTIAIHNGHVSYHITRPRTYPAP